MPPDAEFLRRPELLWKIRQVDGGTFITSNAYGGIEKCLMFSNRGYDATPSQAVRKRVRLN